MQTKKTTLLLIKILEYIVSDDNLHSRFLNTLSFLEYIGTRKMLKSLPASSLNASFLEHINEESRHSLFFKKLAKKISGKDVSFLDYEMLCRIPAEKYFQKMDQEAMTISRSNTILNYLYTTYIVESRATSVYSIYSKILRRNQFHFTLNSILKDEFKHLETVIGSIKKLDPFADHNFETLKEHEHLAYFSLLRSLENEIFKYPQPSTRKASSQKSQYLFASQEQHL